MENNKSSVTALITAYGRAYHSINESPKIFDDFLAKQMITEEEYEGISNNLSGGINFCVPDKAELCKDKEAALKMVIQNQIAPISLSRSRYTEEMLKTAVKFGVKQYVILGAGFDTFAFRNKELLNSIEIFELDFPATQELKLNRIKRAGWDMPSNLHFIPVDFSKNNFIEAIKKSTFDTTKLSFFSWLGVTYYLSKDEIVNTLRSIADVSPKGSSVVFDYPDCNIFDTSKTTRRVQNMVHAAIQCGEPMKSSYSYSELVSDLEKTNFQLYEHLTPLEIQQNYFEGRTDDYRAFENVNFALAVKE